MNILHVIPSYVPAFRHGGPIYAVHGLAKAQVALGHRVTVFTTHADGAVPLDVPCGVPVLRDGVEVWYFPLRFPRRLYCAPELARALAARIASFDIAHLHSLFLLPTTYAARAAERAGVPYLVAPRGMLVRGLVAHRGALRKRLWLALAERRTLERAAGIHATAELEAAEAQRFGFRLPPIYTVPNGIDPASLSPGPGASLSDPVAAALAGGPFVLVLGRISWKKGIDRLIAALPETAGTSLVVAGNDEEGLTPRLSAQAATLGVGDRLRFTGPVAGADKAALLAGATLFVLPSHSENFGNAVLEAMAVGLPVVVTPEVGLAPVVERAGAGLVVPGEPAILAAALRQLLASPATRASMGRNGTALVEAEFGWPAVARRMMAVYEEVRRTPAIDRA